jgi:hypothetical protein
MYVTIGEPLEDGYAGSWGSDRPGVLRQRVSSRQNQVA